MSSTTNPPYNVYLGFCDEDAGSFALELYTALSSQAEIIVFWDDERIGSGDQEIPTSVLNVIEDCEVVVVILSKKYTHSRWCLQELEKITECYRTKDGPVVLPVFYDGFHSSRRVLQEDMYGEAFRGFLNRISMKEITSSEDEDKFMSWVAAITTEASKYCSLASLRYGPNEIGGERISHVVKCATLIVSKKGASFHIESIHSRAQDVIQLLKQSKSPLLLGIWGMTGIGKSAIANDIYTQIGNFFEDKCYLEYVKGAFHTLVSLQENILLDIDKASKIDISAVESGKVILKERLQHKRVLLILDDVDKLEQLEALCGNPDWFGPGSKIIITTRDRHLLKKHGVGNIHPVKELHDKESLVVLNCSAFSQATSPTKEIVELSRQLVAYCGGLPLALKGLGGFLHGKDAFVWKGALRSLESFSFPDQKVIKTLEMSFDDLSGEEKELFLDIAYFFIGMSQNDALQTLNTSTQYCTARQISLLEDKGLVTIDENNKLGMHILLQAMARGIIKRESSNKTNQPKMYDVFLSFRGEDSRAKFVSHLHSSLQNAVMIVSHSLFLESFYDIFEFTSKFKQQEKQGN